MRILTVFEAILAMAAIGFLSVLGCFLPSNILMVITHFLHWYLNFKVLAQLFVNILIINQYETPGTRNQIDTKLDSHSRP